MFKSICVFAAVLFLSVPASSQFDSTRDHSISVSESQRYVDNYKSMMPDNCAGILGFTFSSETIRKVIDQSKLVEGIAFAWAFLPNNPINDPCEGFHMSSVIDVTRSVNNMVVYATDAAGNPFGGVVGYQNSRIYSVRSGIEYTDSIDSEWDESGKGWTNLPGEYINLMVTTSSEINSQLGSPDQAVLFWFGKQDINELIAADEVRGICFQQGARFPEIGGPAIGVLYPIDSNGEVKTDSAIGWPLERSVPCPPFCWWDNGSVSFKSAKPGSISAISWFTHDGHSGMITFRTWDGHGNMLSEVTIDSHTPEGAAAYRRIMAALGLL
jgi:hypothetical protein